MEGQYDICKVNSDTLHWIYVPCDICKVKSDTLHWIYVQCDIHL